MKTILPRLIYYKKEKNRIFAFQQFKNKYFHFSPDLYHTYTDLVKSPPRADYYITGSDQVWNFLYKNADLEGCRNAIHAYFLDFGNAGTRRIAIAASWGTPSIPKEFAHEIAPLISNFDNITVRERSGIDICRFCGIKTAKLFPDTAFLLTADKYRELYSKVLYRKRATPYILVYQIGYNWNLEFQNIKKMANKENIDIIYITTAVYTCSPRIMPGVEEWLALIDNAKYVITNSFHGCVFSIIFNKSFMSITQKNCMDRNTRINSLYEYFCIRPQWYKKGQNLCTCFKKSEIDWTAINTKIGIIQRTFIPSFLQDKC